MRDLTIEAIYRFTDEDGVEREVHANITAEYWEQWGAPTDVLTETMELTDVISDATEDFIFDSEPEL